MFSWVTIDDWLSTEAVRLDISLLLSCNSCDNLSTYKSIVWPNMKLHFVTRPPYAQIDCNLPASKHFSRTSHANIIAKIRPKVMKNQPCPVYKCKKMYDHWGGQQIINYDSKLWQYSLMSHYNLSQTESLFWNNDLKHNVICFKMYSHSHDEQILFFNPSTQQDIWDINLK